MARAQGLPGAAREQERRARPWWQRPLLGLVFAVLMMLNWSLGRLDPSHHPFSLSHALCVVVAGGVAFCWLLPWLLSKLPSFVTVFDRSLIRSQGDAHQQFRFTDLTAFEWRSNPESATLILTRRRGKQIFIGVPHAVPAEALSTFLAERIPARPASV